MRLLYSAVCGGVFHGPFAPASHTATREDKWAIMGMCVYHVVRMIFCVNRSIYAQSFIRIQGY